LRLSENSTGACPLNKTNCKADVDKAQQDIDFAKNNYTVELTTNKGPIRLQFFPDKAPGHVKNFIALSKIGFYDGLTFHRVIKGFMIQGGCPLGTGTGDAGYKIKAEFNSTKHGPGVLSMARSNEPDSAGTQFFVCHEDASFLDGKYTAFGKVSDKESQDTVNKIATSPVRSEKPVDKVVIEKATVKETPR
jgi:peptidyl-prolyl cis-trans isomerase B (cyclophilin B)